MSVRLGVRFTVAVNELPRFGDSSATLALRLLILPYRKSYVGYEDRNLEQKLLPEATGVFNRAIEGLGRLRDRRRFTVPGIAEQVADEFERLSSPLKAFIEDECVVLPREQVSRSRLWSAWTQWCEDNGHVPGSKQLLGVRLRSVIPSIDDHRPRTDGRREWMYIGVGLRGPDAGAVGASDPVGDGGGVATVMQAYRQDDVGHAAHAAVAVASTAGTVVETTANTLPDATTLVESWLHELTNRDDEDRDLFAAKVAEYSAGGRTRWWAERLAFCDVSDAIHGPPPDVPFDLTTLEIQVVRLGREAGLNGASPSAVRPSWIDTEPPRRPRTANGITVPAGGHTAAWADHLKHLSRICVDPARLGRCGCWPLRSRNRSSRSACRRDARPASPDGPVSQRMLWFTATN